MLKYEVVLSYEAINDIVDAEDYIRWHFGEVRSLLYRADIRKEIQALSTDATIYSKSGCMYRDYPVYKKPFPPSILFWVIEGGEVLILRILREEFDWKTYFQENRFRVYTYPDR